MPLDDVEETSNYIDGDEPRPHRIGRAAARLEPAPARDPRRPDVDGVRGGDKEPGEFRRTQNWMGGTRPGNARFVPPPPHEVAPAMSALEKFLHDEPEPTRS